MGNKVSQFEQRFNTNYAFVQAIQDPTYGLVKIYRKKFQNYHYVMVIDRRLQQFKKQTLMSSCISPQKDNNDNMPRILHGSQRQWKQQSSMKLQRLKQTLQLIKRHQNELMIPFFSYRVLQGIPFSICKGSNFNCIEPVIQLYVEYHNHRLIEYLDVLRTKFIPLKINQIVYILKTVCLSISLLTKMQIQVTVKQINVHNIYTSNQGEVKLHPIEIITKKQKQTQNITNIQNLQYDSSINPSIEMKKLNRNQRSSSSHIDKVSNQRHSKSSVPKQKATLLSSNQSFLPYSSKLYSYKQILNKLLIELSPYTLSKSSQNKDLQKLNLIIRKGNSLDQIYQNLQKFDNPGLEGLLVQRIYDLDQNKNKNKGSFHSNKNQKLSVSNMSNYDNSRHQDPVKNSVNFNKNTIKQQQNNQLEISHVQRIEPKQGSGKFHLINYADNNRNFQQTYSNQNLRNNINFQTKIPINPHQNVKYQAISRISQMSQFTQHVQYGIQRTVNQNKQPISLRNPYVNQGLSSQKRQPLSQSQPKN